MPVMKTVSSRYILLTPQTKEFLSIRKHIIDALREDGMEEVASVEEPEWHLTVREKLMKKFGRADFIVADLTGMEPEVMYEYGFAQAMGKPVVLLVQADKNVPFTTEAHQFLAYDPAKPDDLRNRIKRWIWLYQTTA